MNVFHGQIHIHFKKFEAAITEMAWSIVDKVLEAEHKRLTSKAGKDKTVVIPQFEKSSHPPKVVRALTLLEGKVGIWDRGGGPYRVIGRGKVPETFELEHVITGKRINSTLKTLASRWKHIP